MALGSPLITAFLALATLAAIAGWIVVLSRGRLAHRLVCEMSEELRRRTNELQVITEHSPVGIFRWSADGSGVWMNRRYESLLGLSEAQVRDAGWEASAVHEHRGMVQAATGLDLDISNQVLADSANVVAKRLVHQDPSALRVLDKYRIG